MVDGITFFIDNEENFAFFLDSQNKEKTDPYSDDAIGQEGPKFQSKKLGISLLEALLEKGWCEKKKFKFLKAIIKGSCLCEEMTEGDVMEAKIVGLLGDDEYESNNPKKEALLRYFRLENAVDTGINNKPGENLHDSDFKTCPDCFAEKGWDKKFGIILQKFGFDLEIFVEEFNASYKNSSCTLKNNVLKYEGGSCLSLKFFLRIAARQIVFPPEKKED